MITIGITGISGSGKTTVTHMLEALGGYTVEADKLAHMVMRKGQPAYNEIAAAFGTGILDSKGEINRPALGKLVFKDREKLARLEDIIHPKVIALTTSLIVQARETGRYKFAVIDAPLLVEAGMHKNCHSVWLVTANHDIRLARIMARDGISKDAAEKRLASRTGDEAIKPYANTIIENNSENLDDLRKKAAAALSPLLLDEGSRYPHSTNQGATQ